MRRKASSRAGSMLPKVQAALKFVRHNPKGKAIISSLERAREAVEEGCGTIISADEEMLSGVSIRKKIEKEI